MRTILETNIDAEKLQTLTELMYTAKTLYRNIGELHSQICKSQDKSVSELSLDACTSFNKLYDALQTEQKTLLNNIEYERVAVLPLLDNGNTLQSLL